MTPYETLTARVRQIDPAAAEYMEGNAKGIYNFRPDAACLDDAFTWALTPQGYYYWSKIEDILFAEDRLADLRPTITALAEAQAAVERHLNRALTDAEAERFRAHIRESYKAAL